MGANPYEQFVTETNPYAQFLKPEKTYKIGAEGLPDAVKAVAGDFAPHTQLAVGFAGGVNDAALRLKQLADFRSVGFSGKQLADKLSPSDRGQLTFDEEQSVRANRALREESPMAMVGDIGSSLALTGPVAGPAYSAGSKVISKALPSWLAPSLAAGGIGAGTAAATQPVLQGESGVSNAEHGLLGGVLGDAVFRGGARLLSPITQSPAVANLLSKDIVPSIGQSAGGVMNRMEEKATSIPFIGDIITNARNRARNELGTSAINLEMPKGLKVNQPGNAGVEQADELLSDAYKKLYGNTTVTRDAQLVSDIKRAVNAPAIPLSDDYRKMYDTIVKRDVLDRLKAGQTFTSAEVKAEIEGDLGKAIRGLGNKGQEGALRESLLAARQAVRDLAGRQAGVDQVERKAIDTGYANVRAMDAAAGRSEGNAGVPTPLQIIKAAREGSQLQQLGRDAQEVLGNRVPNSGTTDRALMALLLGGVGAGASSTDAYQKTPYLNSLGPAFWLGLGSSPLLYSRPGSKFLAGGYPGQAEGGSAMRSLAPYGAVGGSILLRGQ